MTFYVLPAIMNNINISSFEIQEGKNYIYISHTLHKYLSSVKKKIDKCPVEWDVYKKYTNPYEYIQTQIPNGNQSVATIKPLSRSYFKMIELLKIHNILTVYKDVSINSFHLAEGPGGFIEALVYSRNNTQDKYYGITLITDKVGIPGWNKSNHFLKKNPNVIIERGADGTGNLYHYNNLEYCAKKYGNTMNIITGDGGFDFSVDFNDQESSSTRLLFSQICFALTLQKKEGTFILKLFDCFNRSTMDLIYIVFMFYDNCYITKPLTSRVANSERYLVCCKFKFHNTQHLLPLWKSMYEKIETGISIKGFLKSNIPYYFSNKMEEINLIIGKTQIENILYTIKLITMEDKKESTSKVHTLKKKNIDKCITWCNKYNIPYHSNNENNIFITN